MRQSTILSIVLSMALAVSSSPTYQPSGQCNGGHNTRMCCKTKSRDSVLDVLKLDCLVQVLGVACDGSMKCCSANPTTSNTLVSLNALNCISL
ncbi:hypothetical protein PtrSN002B_008900 [Pyrenophora tritici-repentis]|uniref:Hydrophobin n=1 Tax=Pyrenophora tritici-repentis TaxID=45151 RepID=A0A317AEZ8_9PLEO|nr:hypothetical protein PtrV1_00151 [Pyrenophora tritici-repentis]KAF7575904.1 hypothetical protein PtrM4_001440 [Pyrenophora tritici-repentis]KAI0576999.1 hypothetical protein Alg215_07163 [Pyrenophora tritici-repentis]KAI1519778.1 hypothetical protein Ptr86124_000146 [Pyrenophora tritici-repentis]KAI1539516.1 hypothetical protein PtrSN002B_008900 [Pyrenophora tritici-repentis]